jgi:hydrogenase nickel incorporation protein HypA/HybF
MGIAQSVMEAVEGQLEQRPGAKLLSIGLRIGEFAGVDASSLTFSFECLVKDTPFEGVGLTIEPCRRQHRCAACGKVVVGNPFLLVCPECGSASVTAEGGDELEIAYVELEEP